MQEFDIIVVGAGHAGCEAALASARMGMKTAIFTISLDTIGVMSCNPSLGGPAKSHLAREIDALGGEMGRNIDKTFIQIRVLNTRKGPAVRSLRAQADKMAYANEMKKTLEHTDNLSVIQGMVSELVVEEENGKKVIKGIKIREGLEYKAKAVIIATGTFLRGLIHIGEINFSAGRMGELSSEDLPLSLEKIGLKLGRFKTGTPTRIDGRTIDYSVLEEQPGDKSQVLKFSNRTKDEDALNRRQIPCYIAHTNEKVHEIIRNAKERSPLFNGTIQGLGPRYCPSIEDKIFRYPDKNQHHLFLEREGYETNEIYLGGLSSSLPVDVQEEMLKNIKGFENAKIMRYAYAIEYDYVPPEEIKYTLESRTVENLFLAGQINGTSGYEEAGAQGLMQLMPATAASVGLADVYAPKENIQAAARYIKVLQRSFASIRDRYERIHFILAAYNAGSGHIKDAQALARKYGKNPDSWNDVSFFVQALSTSKYYTDEVVKYGYMIGSQTSRYVEDIIERWRGYGGRADFASPIMAPSEYHNIPRKPNRFTKGTVIVRPDNGISENH